MHHAITSGSQVNFFLFNFQPVYIAKNLKVEAIVVLISNLPDLIKT